MSNQEQLHKVMNGTEWQEAAQEMLAADWKFKEQVGYYAEVLEDRVLNAECAVEQLRRGLSWVNALDAEAAKLGINLDIGDADGTEALARRIAHHAGRSALHRIGTGRKLATERARRNAVSKKYAL